MYAQFSHAKTVGRGVMTAVDVTSCASDAGITFIHGLTRRLMSRLYFIIVRAQKLDACGRIQGIQLVTGVLQHLLGHESGALPRVFRCR